MTLARLPLADQVADDLVATGQRVDRLRAFGGLRLDLRDLPSRFPYVLVTPQYETERVLLGRAEALGVRVLRGTEVTGVRQDPDGVEVDVRTADGTGTLRAAYLVGAVWAVVGGGIGTLLVVGWVMIKWPQVLRLGPLSNPTGELDAGLAETKVGANRE